MGTQPNFESEFDCLTEQEMIENQSSNRKTFTIEHGMAPDIYVPAWKTNVPFRSHSLELAKIHGTKSSTHKDSLYLNKRERLEKNLSVAELERIFKCNNASHFCNFISSLRHR